MCCEYVVVVVVFALHALGKRSVRKFLLYNDFLGLVGSGGCCMASSSSPLYPQWEGGGLSGGVGFCTTHLFCMHTYASALFCLRVGIYFSRFLLSVVLVEQVGNGRRLVIYPMNGTHYGIDGRRIRSPRNLPSFPRLLL